MTENDVIDKILNAKRPNDIIINGDWGKTYKKYSLIIHPDKCKHPKSSDAMAKLVEFKILLEKGTEYEDEQGKFSVFDNKIVYEITDDNRDVLRKSFENFKILKSMKDESSLNFHKYMPYSMQWRSNSLTIILSDRSVPLTKQILPQKHVNWIFSRIFEYTLLLNQVGYAHMGLNPTTVFVVPETHGIIVTSYYHMCKIGDKAKTISAKYKTWYPSKLFKEKIATPDIDLELAKKIALYLLGDTSAAGTILRRNKDVNQRVLDFLIGKDVNSIKLYEKYRNILKSEFKSEFHILDL